MKREELERLLAQMTPEEKAGQLAQCNAALFVSIGMKITGPAERALPVDEAIGLAGSVLTFEGAAQARELQEKHLQADRNRIPMLLMLDVIHGYRTVYPIPLAMGCSFDEELTEACAAMAAKEAAAGGVHVTFQPMVDTARDGRWGRILETCSEEPLVNARMGAAQVRGFQGDDLKNPDRVASCVKHYAAYGAGEAGRDYNTVEISERSLREDYLPAYKACVDAGARLVMPSFNALNGIPSVANKWLMNTVLRGEWGFEGVVVSDYNAVGELVSHGVAEDLKDAVQLAMEAGCDIDMVSTGYYVHLADLVKEGRISEAAVDAAVLRVLELKNELGLFEDPFRGADPEREMSLANCAEHRALARKAAEESAVLLKNDGMLPLKPEMKKIALIGPFAEEHRLNGAWSALGRPEDTVSLAEGLREALPDAEITVVAGCGAADEIANQQELDRAVAAAKAADAVILCLGEPEDWSGEGRSRAEVTVSGAQQALAKQVAGANPKTAAVLINGRPLVLGELNDEAAAILEMWYPGCEGGRAAARLLTGGAVPCGKLSVCLPVRTGQYPLYYSRANTGRPKPEPDSGVFPYTSSYLDTPNRPLYSFGWGLSYTDFIYESLTLDRERMTAGEPLEVTVRVRNAGDRAAKETVQLYLRDLTASVIRPVQQLIDYKKIALQPGETAEVRFTVREEQLRFWDFDCAWKSEPGGFEISTGSADHLKLTKRFELV